MAIKKGLGKGLSALLSIYEDENEPQSDILETKTAEKFEQVGGVSEIALEKIYPNPNQPRKIFDEKTLNELAESIKYHGVIQPIIVLDDNDGKFMVIAGERRYRASKIAGLKAIPAIIKKLTERQVKEMALVENLQRQDLNPVDSAKAIKQLMEEYNFTQEVVADRVGLSRPSVANLLRLLTLSPTVLSLIQRNALSMGQARVLVVIENQKDQEKFANYIIEKKLSVRDVEKLVRAFLNPKKPTKKVKKQEKSPELSQFSNELEQIFMTKVEVLGNDNKGKICIEYFSKDDLDRIYELLQLIQNKTLTLKDLSNFNKRNG